MLKFIAIVCASLVAVTAAPANVTLLDKRATVADGNSVRTGNLLDWEFRYRSAGYVAKGCPPGTGISTCYEYRLSKDPKKDIDTDSERHILQRNEFYSATKLADGKAREYTFKMNVDRSITSIKQTNPLPIVGLDTGEGTTNAGNPGMPVYLDLRNNLAGIYTDERREPVIAMPLADFVGRPTHHLWEHKPGSPGYIKIKIMDDITKQTLLTFNKTGQFSLGTYR
ncbi:hypothetical protein RhiJN_12992 [Ceratobasidium sp. AG-Ba]|nr:hypothetical protein RhiJN_12992 [Ceratobasidium sp. AG-Ba]